MPKRMLLNHFSIDNPIYGMAQVSVWLTATTGEMLPTQVLAQLYSDSWSDTTLGNPIKLTKELALEIFDRAMEGRV